METSFTRLRNMSAILWFPFSTCAFFSPYVIVRHHAEINRFSKCCQMRRWMTDGEIYPRSA